MKTNFIKTLFVTLFLLSVNIVNAHDFVSNGIYYNITDATNKTVAVTYSGSFYNSVDNEYTGSVVIPESVSYNGKVYSVTSIRYYAFRGCSGLTGIEIPNSVTSIGIYVFYGCTKLTSIEIPNSVTSIGEGAFAGCSGLTSIEIPNSVTSVGSDAFWACSGLTSIEIPNSITSIGSSAFSGCYGLTSIIIPNSVTSIGSYAFYNCFGLTRVAIGNSVTSIGDYAFEGCSNLKSVINLTNLTFSKGSSNYGYVAYYADKVINDPKATFVGDFVFSTVDGKHTLVAYFGDATEITLPGDYNGENYPIGDYAFYGCSGLTSIVIPNSVTSIGSYAFYNCKRLTSIEIPNSVTSIGSSAFYNCKRLTSIEIPNSITSIGSSAFRGCSGLTSIEIPNSVTSIGSSAFEGCSGLTSIEIPNSVTSIGDSAFSGCSGLTSIEIPNSVTSIGDSAFSGCSGLTSIEIPNSVTSIGSSAFYGCNNIKFLEINTASVGTMFRDMKSLKKLVIGNDIENIPDNAFNGCSNLSSVTVGSKIKEIKSYSFNGCNNIAKVFWLTNTPPTGYEYLFGKINYVSNNKYTKLENKVVTQFLSSNFEIDGIVYIPTSLADRKCCVADYNPGVNNRGVSIPSTVTYQGVELIVGDIMPHAFYKNELAEATALENKGMVGESAFEGCNNLARVEIPQSITRIEDHAFRNCTALTDAFFFDRETQLPLGAQLFAECPLDTLYLGAKIEYISEASESTSPFSGNKSLKTVIITDVETDIYDYEFYDCSGLEMAVVGDGVERIGRWTFSGCSSLKSFTFGSNVSTIGEEAFSDCTAVTNITGRAVQPPVCGAQALDDINKWNCTLSVPSQNGNSYKTAEQWKEFVKIENFVTTDNYVTYILEGEVYKTLLLTPGKRIIAPYVADKEDAPFAGWDLNEYMQDVTINGPTKIETENITEKITLRYPVMPDRDIIVYGWYARKEYTITYIVDGEVFATDSIAFGSEITLREQPTKEGYTFSGWSEAPTTMPAKDITIEGTFILDNTAIDDIEFENKEITVYDLNGIRVHDTENLTRGIYIINGKKVLVK